MYGAYVTRCPCNQNNDNVGWMIQCEKCDVWQHAECVGVTKANEPDEYFCEKCRPNHPIHKERQRARAALLKTFQAAKGFAPPVGKKRKAANTLKEKKSGKKGKVFRKGERSSKRTRQASGSSSNKRQRGDGDTTVQQMSRDDMKLLTLYENFQRIEDRQKRASQMWEPTKLFQQAVAAGKEVEAKQEAAANIRGRLRSALSEPSSSSSTNGSGSTPTTPSAAATSSFAAEFYAAGGAVIMRQTRHSKFPTPIRPISVPDKKKAANIARAKEKAAEKKAAREVDKPRPYIRHLPAMSCAGFLTLPWREAVPQRAPMYLGKKFYVLKTEVEQDEATLASQGGATLSGLQHHSNACGQSLTRRFLTAYRAEVKARTNDEDVAVEKVQEGGESGNSKEEEVEPASTPVSTKKKKRKIPKKGEKDSSAKPVSPKSKTDAGSSSPVKMLGTSTPKKINRLKRMNSQEEHSPDTNIKKKKKKKRLSDLVD